MAHEARCVHLHCIWEDREGRECTGYWPLQQLGIRNGVRKELSPSPQAQTKPAKGCGGKAGLGAWRDL